MTNKAIHIPNDIYNTIYGRFHNSTFRRHFAADRIQEQMKSEFAIFYSKDNIIELNINSLLCDVLPGVSYYLTDSN